jgi:hypothetical protein
MENNSKGKVLGDKKAMWGGSIQPTLLVGNLSPNISRNHYGIKSMLKHIASDVVCNHFTRFMF